MAVLIALGVARSSAAPGETGWTIFDKGGVVLGSWERGESGSPNPIFVQDSLARPVLADLDLKAEPGDQIFLTLDVRLQRAAEEALKNVERGAVVVLDCQSGAILAMASVPAVDRGADPDLEDGTVTLHRAIRVYPPGAAFLPVTSIAGALTGHATNKFMCGGGVQYGSRFFKCWVSATGSTHGSFGLSDALKVSCNSYFYQYGNAVSAVELARAGALLGLGEVTGIPLRGEAAGTLPDPEWLRALRPSDEWSDGQTANTAIGQGYVHASPLQLAVVAAAIANGGTVYRPRLVDRRLDAGGAVHAEGIAIRSNLRKEGLERGDLDLIRHGMWQTVNAEGGSASRARIEGGKVAGRTGTAQIWEGEKKSAICWFLGFAPYEKAKEPKYAICVLVEGGKAGGLVAAPIAREVLETALSESSP